jgi:hypothetical protein
MWKDKSKSSKKDDLVVAKKNPYAQYGMAEEAVFAFLQVYASSGSVAVAANSCKMVLSDAYRLVLLREFQDHLTAYNTLDNQMLDVKLTSAVNIALAKALDLVNNGERIMIQVDDGKFVETRVPARLKDIVSTVDKVFRARNALRGAGVAVSRHEAEELNALRKRLREKAEIAVPPDRLN